MLSEEQKRRYARNITLAGFGEAGQQHIAGSSVLVIGAGALGSVVATYLAGAGVGHLTVIDFDAVDVSNLQRQVFYTTAAEGNHKVIELRRHLHALNPDVEVRALSTPLTCDNCDEILSGHDVIVECTDSAAVKHLVAAASVHLHIPCVIGGVRGWNGQVISLDGHTDSYTKIFGSTPGQKTDEGICGPVAGHVATMQALEAIKILTGCGQPLYRRLWLFDGLTSTPTILRL